MKGRRTQGIGEHRAAYETGTSSQSYATISGRLFLVLLLAAVMVASVAAATVTDAIPGTASVSLTTTIPAVPAAAGPVAAGVTAATTAATGERGRMIKTGRLPLRPACGLLGVEPVLVLLVPLRDPAGRDRGFAGRRLVSRARGRVGARCRS